MKIEIITTGEKVETVNYILGIAIDELLKNDRLRESFDLTESKVRGCETFRKQLIKAYFKKPKK